MTLAPTQGPQELSFQNSTVLVTATTAVTKGRFVAFTTLQDPTSPYGPATVIHAVAADAVLPKVIGLALEDIAAAGTGSVLLQGVGKMLSSASRVVLLPVGPAAAGAEDVVAAGDIPCALTIEAASGSGEYIDVYVDGMSRPMAIKHA